MSEPTFKHLSVEEFDALDFDTVTLVDLREPDELIVSSIPGALNLPISQGLGALMTLPDDKPVVIYCRVGDVSEEAAEVLADLGYDVCSLDGGYNAYRFRDQ